MLCNLVNFNPPTFNPPTFNRPKTDLQINQKRIQRFQENFLVKIVKKESFIVLEKSHLMNDTYF